MKKVIIAVAAAAAGAVAGYMIKDKMDKKADGNTAKTSGDGQTTNATSGLGDPYFAQYIPLSQQVEYLYEPRLIQ